MSTLLESPGYYGATIPVVLADPQVVCVGRAHDAVAAGYPVRVGWSPSYPGEGVEWAEIAIGFQVAGHGDPGIPVAGWASIAADLGGALPVYTTITLDVDIPAGSVVYAAFAASAKVPPAISGSVGADVLRSGRVGVGTDDGTLFRPSTATGTTSFNASSLCPVRVSVLLP